MTVYIVYTTILLADSCRKIPFYVASSYEKAEEFLNTLSDDEYREAIVQEMEIDE